MVEDFVEKRNVVESGELVGVGRADSELRVAGGEVGRRQNCLEVNISPLIGTWGPSHFIVQVVVGVRAPDEVRTLTDLLKKRFGGPKGSSTISDPTGVSMKGKLVELGVCSDCKVKDFLNELFSVVVDSEVDSVVRGSVGDLKSKRNVFAALVHVDLVGFVFRRLEHSSWGGCPWANHLVVSEFREKIAWSGHLCGRDLVCWVW